MEERGRKEGEGGLEEGEKDASGRGMGGVISTSVIAPPWQGPLPRVFVSELCVEQMSDEVRAIVREYTREAAALPVASCAVPLNAALGVLPWRVPSREHYDVLAR